MKCSIDNAPPKRHSHLHKNLKKEQLMEERFAEIERDNRLLLEKMSYIMRVRCGGAAAVRAGSGSGWKRAAAAAAAVCRRHAAAPPSSTLSRNGPSSPRSTRPRAPPPSSPLPLQHTSLDNVNTSTQYGHSLNKEQRKRELQRITKDNQVRESRVG